MLDVKAKKLIFKLSFLIQITIVTYYEGQNHWVWVGGLGVSMSDSPSGCSDVVESMNYAMINTAMQDDS